MKSRLMVGIISSLTTITLFAAFFWLTNLGEAQSADSPNRPEVVQNTSLARFLSLAVSAAKPYGNADFDNLGSPHRYRYISFPASGYSALLTDFTLPPDYATGTAVSVRFMVNGVGDCFVVLGATSIYESPAVSAGADIQFPDGDPPAPNPQWTAHKSELRPFSISVHANPSSPFQPGDSISVALNRDGDGLNDTCGEILISGMSVTYEGLSTFIPLATR